MAATLHLWAQAHASDLFGWAVMALLIGYGALAFAASVRANAARSHSWRERE